MNAPHRNPPRSVVYVFVLSLSLVSWPGLTHAVDLNAHAAKAWKSCRGTLVDILKLEDEKTKLPNRAIIRRDKTDADDDINELLDEALRALEVSALVELRERYETLRKKNKAVNALIAEYNEKRVSAASGPDWKPFTKESYDKKIKNLKKEVRAIQKEQAKIRSQMVKE